ncbi:MAG: FAD-linked oxidase C-terminal domain-containing protein [Candidatus Hydrothermales bacterium]
MPEFVFIPENVEDVSQFVKFCFRKNIYITPRGGGTGLSGGAVPLKGGVISFEKMNKIIDLDPINQTITLEPGIITGDINKVLLSENLFYPPDPMSLDSCTIGGNVATNAGGPRAYKYGVTSNYLIELECVLPNGNVVNVGRGTKKWKTGYNLLSLLCSSEGTLALFTKIKLKLIPRPEKEVLTVMSFQENEDLFNFVIKLIKNKFFPSIIEFMDKGCVRLVRKKVKHMFPEEHSLLFVGFDGDEEEIEKILEKLYDFAEKEKIERIFIGDDKSSVDRIWEIRKKMFYETEKEGFKVHSEDICVTIKTAQNFINDVKNLFKNYSKEPYIFGHLGDGNIHINLTYKKDEERLIRKISEEIWDLAIKIGGTITAEHGVGYLKKKGFRKETDPILYKIQREIKRTFDPKGILNPGKLF